MRLAALYDIHGNLPALEAVLREARDEKVEQIVVGGDLLLGPMPRETWAYLRALDIPVGYIRGNCDREILVSARRGKSDAPEQARLSARWVAGQLGEQDLRAIEQWPPTLTIRVDGIGDVLFCHATPRSDTENFTRLTPESAVQPAFANVGAAVVVCGHTHMQFDRMIGATRVVNAGSVGMPFGGNGAQWLLLGPGIELRQTPHDLAATAARIRASGYPAADEFADRYVLHPFAEQEMLQVFSRGEMK